MFFFQSTPMQWPNGKTTPYGQTIDEQFCSFMVIMSDLGGINSCWQQWNGRESSTQHPHQSGTWFRLSWPNAQIFLVTSWCMTANVRLSWPGTLARIYCPPPMLWLATWKMGLSLSQFPRAVHRDCVPGLQSLQGKPQRKSWISMSTTPQWHTWGTTGGGTSPDQLTQLMDLLQPLLACESWDWRSTTTAKVMMRWAGLLSIVGLEEDANEGQFQGHVGEVMSWQEHGSNYLCHVPLARTLEGSPRGHPNNVNMHYLKGKEAWLTVLNIERNADKLDEMFQNLLDDGRMPMRQTTANACATLNGMQVASAKVKTSWDGSNAGFKQQALLLTDFFSRHNFLEKKPEFPIGLHLNSNRIKIQTLQLDYDQASSMPLMLMSRHVFESVPYTLRLSVDSAARQDRATMPAIFYREGGTEKAMPALNWGTVKPRFQPYLVAIMQVMCKLRALYAENDYGLQGLAWSVGRGNDNKWTNCTGLPHQMPRGNTLPQSVQNCYYEAGFKVYQKVRKWRHSDSRSSESGSEATGMGSGVTGTGSGATRTGSEATATGS